jgi:hypothetical protein
LGQPDLIEISLVFEAAEPVRSLTERQTVPAEARAKQQEEPRREKAAALKANAGKTSKERELRLAAARVAVKQR